MLSIVSTPIGNLGDVTLRAIETLKTCDAVVCEDTRVTGQLLKLLDLPKKELISMHGYSNPKILDDVISRLKNGAHLALVSDAGTPGISDPGYKLMHRCREEGLTMEAIPGPAAFLAALSISGLPIHHFRYLGFLPMKKGRQTLLHTFIDEEETIVFYESVHRIQKTLQELANLFTSQPDRPIVIARELTKMHEEIVSVTVRDLPDLAGKIVKKGEFVVIVGPPS